jgi:hypothetical protein
VIKCKKCGPLCVKYGLILTIRFKCKCKDKTTVILAHKGRWWMFIVCAGLVLRENTVHRVDLRYSQRWLWREWYFLVVTPWSSVEVYWYIGGMLIGFYQTTWHCNPGDHTLKAYRIFYNSEVMLSKIRWYNIGSVSNCWGAKDVDSKRFWQWCVTFGITGFLDFVHHTVF